MYKLLLTDNGGRASPASSTGNRSKGASIATKPRRNRLNACFQFSSTQTCSFGDSCKFSHEKPAATEARVPAGGGARGRGGDGIAGASGQNGDGMSNALVVRTTGGGDRGAQGDGSGRGAPGYG